MYAIIMGGGRVGLGLANLLIDNGADITLIESDESLCNDIASELDALGRQIGRASCRERV